MTAFRVDEDLTSGNTILETTCIMGYDSVASVFGVQGPVDTLTQTFYSAGAAALLH